MRQLSISYTDLKAKATALSAAYHYIDFTANYGVFIYDPNNDVLFDALPSGADETDFETNIQPTATQHTTHDDLFKVLEGQLAVAPKRQVEGFTHHDTSFYRKSYRYDAPVGVATDFDEKFAVDCWLAGGGYSVGLDVTEGDYIEFSVVDVDGVIPGVPPGTVLNKYIETEYVKVNDEHFINGNSAAFIPAGVYLRTTYHSTGTGQDVPFIIRYELRK